MKNFLFISLLAASAISVASAKVPEKLAGQTSDTDAIAFYNAMDCFEAENPDGMTVVTYDSYPYGLKIISRRIDWPWSTKAYDRVCAVFDSITAKNIPSRITVRNNDGRSQVRVYKLKETDNDNTIDLSSGSADTGGTSACVTMNGGIVLAQNWTIRSGVSQGKPNLTKLNSAIRRLAKGNNAYVRNVTFNERERSISSGLRPRMDELATTNTLECERIVVDDARVQQWIDLHHTFMDTMGEDGLISLTYNRNNRMVTLVDMANKTIYAARFRSSASCGGAPGMLYVLVGHYKDGPFLPENWATSM